MWFNGFQVFFKVKHVINLVKNGAAFSKQSLQMLEEARSKKQEVTTKDKKKQKKKKSSTKVTMPEKESFNVGLKGKLGQ